MKAQSKATASVEEVEVQITFTAPVREWRALMRQMPTEYPGWRFGAMISATIGTLVRAVDQTMEPFDVE